MKNKVFLLICTILIGCSGSPTRTAFQAERNRMDMMDIKINMSIEEVRDRMGMPKKVEKRTMNGIEYEIWYYVTRGVNLDQTRYIDENFTPFVFYGSCLRGWGWHFYNYLFDINNARFKREEESKSKYNKKQSEIPTYEHKIITPYEKEPNKESVDEALKNFIEVGKEDKPNNLNKLNDESTKTDVKKTIKKDKDTLNKTNQKMAPEEDTKIKAN